MIENFKLKFKLFNIMKCELMNSIFNKLLFKSLNKNLEMENNVLYQILIIFRNNKIICFINNN